jgi:hypothetical protein
MSRFHVTDYSRPPLPAGQHLARQLMAFTDDERSQAHWFAARVVEEEEGPTALGRLMAAIGLDLLAVMYSFYDASVELAEDIDRMERGGDV